MSIFRQFKTLFPWVKGAQIGHTDDSKTEQSVELEAEEESPKFPDFPEHLDRIQTSNFATNWGGSILGRLLKIPTFEATDDTTLTHHSKPITLSVKISRMVNCLEIPFRYTSIAFAVWMIIEALIWCWFMIFKGVIPESINHYTQLIRPYITYIIAPISIGYATNWVAIKMLFHPRHPNQIWQGLIPARRDELIEAMSDGILTRLISPEIVREYLHSSGLIRKLADHFTGALITTLNEQQFKKELKSLIYGYIHNLATDEEMRKKLSEFVQNKLADWVGQYSSGIAASFFKIWWSSEIENQVAKALPELPDELDHLIDKIDVILEKMPIWIDHKSESIEGYMTDVIVEMLRSLDIKTIVKRQLNQMNEEELEQLLTGNVVDELVFIQVMGGVFGLLVGAAIYYPLIRVLLLFAVLFILREFWISERMA
jgi:uncharacterized membrane protein YheB (UPF0754 family)